MTHKSNILSLLLACLGLALWSCQSDLDLTSEAKGGLRAKLENVLPSVVTRSTPADLGAPGASNFVLNVTDASGAQKYSGAFTDDVIHLPAGRYTVAASCGDNPVIGIDEPYYVGQTSVDVADDKVTEAAITCSVANALVSVNFGQDEAERARFDKFYSSYSLAVVLDDHKAYIYNTASMRSVYFRAGSSVTLEFEGVLRADGQSVTVTLDASQAVGFPSVFSAADHAIVTLTLPDPESAAVVDISKVVLEEATVEGTVPLSWLPLPKATAQHQYDADGDLVGTDIRFTNTFPGMEWSAIVADAATGEVRRTVSGQGELLSDWSMNKGDWPYLPEGEYTATYSVSLNGSEYNAGSRTFSVGRPNLHITTDCYTSYTKYLEGDVDGANACDAYTIYKPGVRLNVSNALLANGHYAKSCEVTLAGQALSGGSMVGSAFVFPDQTGKAPSFSAYNMSAAASFDKAQASLSEDYYITGLPVVFNPPTREAGWYVAANKVTWTDDNVQLGYMAGAGAHAIACDKFAVPTGTKIDCPYKVRMHGATVATTLTLTAGGTEYFRETSSSGAFNNKNHDYESNAVFVTKDNVSTVKANSSYGSGQTYSVIYSLSYLYAK